MSHIKGLIGFVLLALLLVTYFCLLGWFYFLCKALLGRYPTALTLLTSCGLQCNPCFTCSFAQWPLRVFLQEHPAICLASVALLNHGGRFHNLFSCVSFMILKLQSCSWVALPSLDDCFWWRVGPLHLQKLSFIVSN